MSLVAKALWYIESHLGEDLSLAGIAADLGVSTFHLSRAFTLRTGQPVMRFVWRRRLAQAALALGEGGGTVLGIALDAGYGSPEAFARAFRAEFGVPPTRIRTAGAAGALALTQPIMLNGENMRKLQEPKVEERAQLVLVGPSRRYDMQTRVEIPAQWTAYNDDGRRVPGAVPDVYWGAVHDFADDGTFGYICGQAVEGPAVVPDGFSRLVVPAGRYARFASDGHVSEIGDAWAEVYEHWMGRPGLAPRPGASLEFYPARFDPRTGEGGFEVWVPVS